jgi:hypothetical protein
VSKQSRSCAQQMGIPNDTHTEGAALRPRETFEGSRGPLFSSLVITRNKHSDCPQNPAHLRPPTSWM